jgi:hypothetical protein
MRPLAASAETPRVYLRVHEWFDYASERVPQLQQENSGAASLKPAAIQHPRAFYRQDPEAHLVVATAGSNTLTAQPRP